MEAAELALSDLAISKDGCRMVSISIDDFYLSRAEQIALAKRYSDNPFLQQRGYPGTHDVGLGVSVLTALKTTESRFMPETFGL
jgi:D-glycerate 3-kinase